MNVDDIRAMWNPAPESRLDRALWAAVGAAAQLSAARGRLSQLQAEGDALQGAPAGGGWAEPAAALTALIRRVELDVKRLCASARDAERDVSAVLANLNEAGRAVDAAARRWGIDSRQYEAAAARRSAVERRYLVALETAAAEPDDDEPLQALQDGPARGRTAAGR